MKLIEKYIEWPDGTKTSWHTIKELDIDISKKVTHITVGSWSSFSSAIDNKIPAIKTSVDLYFESWEPSIAINAIDLVNTLEPWVGGILHDTSKPIIVETPPAILPVVEEPVFDVGQML